MNGKKEQRAICRKRLAALTTEEKRLFSERIADKLLAHPYYTEAKRVFLYRSAADEADTRRIAEDALKQGKEVYYPQLSGEDMYLVRYEKDTEMKLNFYGIEEPVGTPYHGEIDLAVIPLLGFDRLRTRLGRGKGYYDRFLAGYTGRSIALAFSVQELDAVTREERDVAPEIILTEKEEI